jgi:hypothetical protein
VILCVLMRKFRDQLLELHKDRGSRERDEWETNTNDE